MVKNHPFSTLFLCIFCYIIRGDIMKKRLFAVLGGVVTGLILSLIAITKLSFEVHSEETLNVFVLQAGVFENYQNAQKKSKLTGGSIYKDNNNYLVLNGASISESGIDKISSCLKEKYYKKRITINSSNKDKISKYETILNKTTDEEAILYINKQIMGLVTEK